MTSLKILVGYHKPAQLLKSDILIPIHLGRALATQASKDGKMSNDDYQWMLDNMIGDDTGDNISQLNRHFCELTGIYWAWKNYDKLGNPDYIGLSHYRRLFNSQDIAAATDYDIIAPQPKSLHRKYNIYDFFCLSHPAEQIDLALEMMTKQQRQASLKYLHNNYGYYYNMFIMKKELFFEYCEFLFNILLPLHQKTDYNKYSFYNQRLPGFLAERLTGAFIAMKEKSHKVLPCEVAQNEIGINRPLAPQFGNKGIAICFSADDNYAPPLAVAIASLKTNRNTSKKYDICIIDGGISRNNKKRILKLADTDFSIRFIDISGFMGNINKSIFKLHEHFTLAAYYRLFIPQIFANYQRVLYLDCDIAIAANIEELYQTDLENKPLAVVLDIEICRNLFYYENNKKWNDYLQNTLKMNNPQTYFQSGVILFDIAKLQQMNFTTKCLQKLQEIGDPIYVDQDILNAIFDGNYKPLDMHWNVLWQTPYYCDNLDNQLPIARYREYYAAYNNPSIVHYAGAIKPWKNPEVELADIWWSYARLTPFYEEILYKNNLPSINILDEILNLRKNKLKYLAYKILSNLTFGKTRNHFDKLRKKYKKILKQH